MVRVLSEREFRLLWLGQSASTIGDAMVMVAIALYVTAIGTPTDVGLVLAAHSLTLVACLTLGGVWADRLPRHRVMLATDFIRGSLHALLAALILTGSVEVWMIAAIEAVYGAAEAFFRPAYTGLVPQTVPEPMLPDANAATAIVQTVAEFLGPALATVLVLGIGAGWAFAFDALTFVVSACFLARLRPRSRGEAVAGGSVLSDLREGWSEFWARAWVWATVLIFCFLAVVAFAPWQVLAPTVAQDRYGSRALFGTLAAALGVGTIAGALCAFRLRPRRPMLAAFVGCVPWPLSIVLFAAGAPRALSRVSAYDWMGSLGLLPIAYIAVGPVADALGATAVLAAGGAIGCFLVLLGFAIPDIWRLRRLEAPV